jgi:hypothetical protein
MIKSSKEESMKERSKPRLNAGVSLFFEGLMITCFTKDNRCQVGIYTNPGDPEHLFAVSVYDERNFRNGAIAYKQYTCSEVKQAAPLWLYVDMGNGRHKDLCSATRFAPLDQSDPRNFDHVLDFDGPELHGPPDEVTIIPGTLSILNVLQGLFYAAQLENFQRQVTTPHAHNSHAKGNICVEPVALLNKATLVGAQIELPEKDNLQLKLEASYGEELLSVTLERGVQYVVYVEHAPEPPADPHKVPPPQRSHFHRFYDAIKPKSGIHYDITELPETMEVKSPPHFLPCSAPTVGRHYSLE